MLFLPGTYGGKLKLLSATDLAVHASKSALMHAGTQASYLDGISIFVSVSNADKLFS